MTDFAKLTALVDDVLDKTSTHLQWLGTNCRVLVDLFEQAQEANAMIHAAILKLKKKGAKGEKLIDFKVDPGVAQLLKGQKDVVSRFVAKQTACLQEEKKTPQFVKLLGIVEAQIAAAAKDPANARNSATIKTLVELMKTIHMCHEGIEDVATVPAAAEKDIALADANTLKQIASKADTKYKIDLDALARVHKLILTEHTKVTNELKQKFADLTAATTTR